MSILDGAYRGFATLHASPVGYGEIEVTVQKGALVKYRLTTGSRIIEVPPPSTAPLRHLTEDEVRAYFYPENDTTGYQGYRLDEYGTALVVRTPNPERPYDPLVDAWQLRYPGQQGGMTLLYTPAQVAEGCFDYDIAQWEVNHSYLPGSFPRLTQ